MSPAPVVRPARARSSGVAVDVAGARGHGRGSRPSARARFASNSRSERFQSADASFGSSASARSKRSHRLRPPAEALQDQRPGCCTNRRCASNRASIRRRAGPLPAPGRARCRRGSRGRAASRAPRRLRRSARRPAESSPRSILRGTPRTEHRSRSARRCPRPRRAAARRDPAPAECRRAPRAWRRRAAAVPASRRGRARSSGRRSRRRARSPLFRCHFAAVMLSTLDRRSGRPSLQRKP